MGQNRAAEAPALPADSKPLVSAAAPAAPAVSLLPRQRPRRVVGAAGTGVLCFDGFDRQKWGGLPWKTPWKIHGKYWVIIRDIDAFYRMLKPEICSFLGTPPFLLAISDLNGSSHPAPLVFALQNSSAGRIVSNGEPQARSKSGH